MRLWQEDKSFANTCDGSDWAKVADNGLGKVNTREQNTLQIHGDRLCFVVGKCPCCRFAESKPKNVSLPDVILRARTGELQ